MWNYAELAHLAKDSGGPDVMVKTIFDNGLRNGRIEGIIETAIVIAFIYGINKIKEYVNKNININDDYVDIRNRPIINMVKQNNFEDIPIGCRSCGGPYPNCKSSCPMFDD